MARSWDDDEALLAELRAALRVMRPLAQVVVAQGVGAYAWRTVDEDLVLAQVSFDSATEPADAHRAAAAGQRTVAFTAAPLSLELELGPAGVLGQIVPPAPGRIRIESAQGEIIDVETDEHGFFVLPQGLPAGAVRLRCETDTGRLVTDWVSP